MWIKIKGFSFLTQHRAVYFRSALFIFNSIGCHGFSKAPFFHWYYRPQSSMIFVLTSISNGLCKPPKRCVELVMLLSSGAAVMSCSFCPAGLFQVSGRSAALTWLAGSDLSLPPEQFCWVSLRTGAKPCNWTQGCCRQVNSLWVQLSGSGIWREKKAVAWGKDSW